MSNETRDQKVVIKFLEIPEEIRKVAPRLRRVSINTKFEFLFELDGKEPPSMNELRKILKELSDFFKTVVATGVEELFCYWEYVEELGRWEWHCFPRGRRRPYYSRRFRRAKLQRELKLEYVELPALLRRAGGASLRGIGIDAENKIVLQFGGKKSQSPELIRGLGGKVRKAFSLLTRIPGTEQSVWVHDWVLQKWVKVPVSAS